ncbi:unnamed protein product (macronuclear) [Paramecium tetraurelia]|uniref:Tubulin--tyrosine ligase-like protein 5 n=1 Tax=Paramecium tetraurelia TaxID=5888 RepID=A0DAT4_PARTE|nr:uncharacterized protein GSPATT00015058001 [Paramecium tetraurelia]CAK80151.1 unnamed protein product [Paramecium tetraurelia]|eukprot:XP_001447548.1 hypothetical protein (macronuclear) [Paramecium tetraurelia strain d4-2]
MNSPGDSIDDIISLLNKHYHPNCNQEQQSQQNSRPKAGIGNVMLPQIKQQLNVLSAIPNTYNNNSDKFKRKAASLNRQQQPKSQTKDTNSFLIPMTRYLTFKPYSGSTDIIINDVGYYYKFGSSPIKLVKGLLEENGFKENNDKNWTLYWSSCAIRSEIYTNLFAYQKVCHFPKSYEMTRKDLMHRNISKMQINHGFINFNFIPKTYILPAEMSYFLEEHEKIKNNNPVYICKPHASSQGKGIFITDKIQDILNKQNSNNSYVVSHYIDKPLLINNLKFDLRIYVAITCINPLRIYVYQDGLARFATEAYNPDSVKQNRFVHLTNYSVNKDSPNFVANQDPTLDYLGSKWSLLALREYLKLNKINEQQIFERIEDLIIKTIISVESAIFQACEMNVPFRSNCFSLFGFDVLVDQFLKPWLLEVNFSPSLNIDAPLDLKIKGEMLADLFTLIGIVPLDQRFSQDLSYVRNQSNYDVKKHQQEFEKYILKETEEEFKRSRGWKRLYPSDQSSRYSKYFESDRPLNALLRNYYK